MGRGFWVLDNRSILHEIDSEGSIGTTGGSHLFAIDPQYRSRYFRNSGFGWSNSARPQYPGAGAVIDYWLPPELNDGSVVTIEFINDQGDVVRTF